jgi:hypothetical protein
MTTRKPADDHLQQSQHHPEAADSGIDPVGPIDLPRRSLLGSRASALVGMVGVAAFGVAMGTYAQSTWPTISA